MAVITGLGWEHVAVSSVLLDRHDRSVIRQMPSRHISEGARRHRDSSSAYAGCAGGSLARLWSIDSSFRHLSPGDPPRRNEPLILSRRGWHQGSSCTSWTSPAHDGFRGALGWLHRRVVNAARTCGASGSRRRAPALTGARMSGGARDLVRPVRTPRVVRIARADARTYLNCQKRRARGPGGSSSPRAPAPREAPGAGSCRRRRAARSLSVARLNAVEYRLLSAPPSAAPPAIGRPRPREDPVDDSISPAGSRLAGLQLSTAVEHDGRSADCRPVHR